MKLRLMASAFLNRGGRFLMMKRADTRTLAPGLWAGLGGHIEPGEIDSPEDACRREILEESGLRDKDIHDLRLQCILMRLYRADEIRQQFVYFGETDKETVIDTEEGALQWIPEADILGLDMTKTTKIILQKHLSGGFNRHCLYIGVSKRGAGEDIIDWNIIEDFDQAHPPLFA